MTNASDDQSSHRSFVFASGLMRGVDYAACLGCSGSCRRCFCGDGVGGRRYGCRNFRCAISTRACASPTNADSAGGVHALSWPRLSVVHIPGPRFLPVWIKLLLPRRALLLWREALQTTLVQDLAAGTSGEGLDARSVSVRMPVPDIGSRLHFVDASADGAGTGKATEEVSGDGRMVAPTAGTAINPGGVPSTTSPAFSTKCGEGRGRMSRDIRDALIVFSRCPLRGESCQPSLRDSAHLFRTHTGR